MDRRRRKNSKYFLSLEKRNYTNELISTLAINDNIVKNLMEISEAQSDFFQGLYSEELNERDHNYKNSLNEFLLNNGIPKLSIEQKETCDKPISESEIFKSIRNLSSGKTPGSDGQPTDFYKFFWCDIKSLLTQSIIHVMEKGELSIEQKRGIITLLPKKGKNRLYLKN